MEVGIMIVSSLTSLCLAFVVWPGVVWSIGHGYACLGFLMFVILGTLVLIAVCSVGTAAVALFFFDTEAMYWNTRDIIPGYLPRWYRKLKTGS